MDIQLKRGVIEICVLASLGRGESYGYQIIKDVSSVVSISESTLYPILKRLEAGNCLTVTESAHNGRLRKYYSLTDTGRDRIAEFLDGWKDLARMRDFIWEGYNNHDKA